VVFHPLIRKYRFAKVIQSLPDTSIDIPNGPKLFGKFVARAIQDKILDSRWLSEHLPKLLPSEENGFSDVASKFLPEFFLTLRENCGLSQTRQVLRKTNINVRDYLPQEKRSDEQFDKWLKEKGLEWLFPSTTYEKELEEIILKGTKPEEIETWIKVHYYIHNVLSNKSVYVLFININNRYIYMYAYVYECGLCVIFLCCNSSFKQTD
jgi:hypothetical protein